MSVYYGIEERIRHDILVLRTVLSVAFVCRFASYMEPLESDMWVIWTLKPPWVTVCWIVDRLPVTVC